MGRGAYSLEGNFFMLGLSPSMERLLVRALPFFTDVYMGSFFLRTMCMRHWILLPCLEKMRMNPYKKRDKVREGRRRGIAGLLYMVRLFKIWWDYHDGLISFLWVYHPQVRKSRWHPIDYQGFRGFLHVHADRFLIKRFWKREACLNHPFVGYLVFNN